MLEQFLLIGLPYAALFVLVFGLGWRFKTNRYGVSALTSQFLENRRLLWGAIPWHAGIAIVLLGHLAAFVFPGLWRDLVGNPTRLMVVESIGAAAATLALLGLVVLLVRRITVARLQPVTSVMDFALLALLLVQVLTGLGIAHAHRSGALWATQTATPYLWSLFTFRPDAAYVEGLPGLVKLHIVGNWIIVMLIPFSRLPHMFSLPLRYLVRPPLKVVWATARRFERNAAAREALESRRLFLKATFGLGTAGVLLSLGTFDKLFRFFRGPAMAATEEVELLRKKLHRLEQAASQRELELERLGSEYIFVAQLEELSPTEGKYFTDYQMRPALAFRGPDGLPLLISAKCTHLGCTVASQVDAEGRLLCPCHISYFDLRTGQPNAGSPAKDPLPILGWVLKDAAGNVLAGRGPNGTMDGTVDPATLAGAGVYIAKGYEETA
jgi:nitrate reductase gamma subunit